MLVKNVGGERTGASMLKNSAFYIEIAKFVQAYTTIVRNPNVFLNEIGEGPINEDNEKVTWKQFTKIMKTCDFGFNKSLTDEELIVYYNYALEIGSLDRLEKRIASVDEVADAQKHYYNFIEEAKDKAEAEYLSQHRITENREKEVALVDNRLSLIKAVNVLSMIFMCVFAGLAAFAVVSFFYDNAFIRVFGFFLKGNYQLYFGAVNLIIVSLIMFMVFDELYLWSKRNYIKLKDASEVIFAKEDEAYAIEEVLKHKLTDIDRDFKIVQTELNDKEQKYDVKVNINKLKKTNKYYKELCSEEEYSAQSGYASDTNKAYGAGEGEYAPVKLTKEQAENLHTVTREAITLEGMFDTKAYNEKFERSRLKPKKSAEAENNNEEVKQKEKEETQIKEEKQTQKQSKQQKEIDQTLQESLDYLKDILGLDEDIQKNL